MSQTPDNLISEYSPALSYYNGNLDQVTFVLQEVCKSLQIDAGLLANVPKTELSKFVYLADRYVEDRLRMHYQTPFQKVIIPVPDSSGGTSEILDFPPVVKESSLWRALELILSSQYFENAANKSEAAMVTKDKYERILLEARHRTRFRTGPNRRKHPNPHLPPNIAPMVNEEAERL